jgi:hypothetical protein
MHLTHPPRVTPEAFAAACNTVTRFINDPETGWDEARGDQVEAQLKQWRLDLQTTAYHAACDAEKS